MALLSFKLSEEAQKYRDQIAYQTKGSAGFDLVALKDYLIHPGEIVLIGTGVFIEKHGLSFIGSLIASAIPIIPEVQIRPRSSLAKKGITAQFGTGDCDYRQELGVLLKNESKEQFAVAAGDRIGQAVVGLTVRPFGIRQHDTVRTGGFGSTNK